MYKLSAITAMIVCDPNTKEWADCIRSLLEIQGFTVTLLSLYCRSTVTAYLDSERGYDFSILALHGYADMDENTYLLAEVYDDITPGADGSRVQLEMENWKYRMPQTGTAIAIGCQTGNQRFGKSMLDNGFGNFIANPTNDVTFPQAIVWVCAFFEKLMREELMDQSRLREPGELTIDVQGAWRHANLLMQTTDRKFLLLSRAE